MLVLIGLTHSSACSQGGARQPHEGDVPVDDTAITAAPNANGTEASSGAPASAPASSTSTPGPGQPSASTPASVPLAGAADADPSAAAGSPPAPSDEQANPAQQPTAPGAPPSATSGPDPSREPGTAEAAGDTSGVPAPPDPLGPGGSASDPDEPAATTPGVHFVGRFEDDGAQGMRFEWSGSGIVAAFDGSSVSVTLEDSGENHFTVLIDGEQLSPLIAQAGSHSYELASGLPAGTHRVELYRRTEALFGMSAFVGFDFGGGRLLPPPSPAQRRIEIVGDSISCGYGNEGDSATCGFSAETENHYATYGAIAARALDAEVVTIAWSGKGVVYNYDTDTTDPLPALYDRSLPSDANSTWSFGTQPDAVVINLGTNDYSTEGDPSMELFQEHYVRLLERLRSHYPDAFILCTVGPLLNGADLAAARTGIDAAVDARTAAGDTRLASWEMNIGNDNPGCDYHPSVATHQAMADALVEQLRVHLDW